MNEFFQQQAPTCVISSTSKESIGTAFGNAGWTTAGWPAANKAILTPFVIEQTFIVRGLACFNGSPLSGNLDIGIYDQGRALRVHTGAKVQAGIHQPQFFRVPDIELHPGSYWLAMVMDNTTAVVYRRAATTGQVAAGYGICQITNAFPLPENIDGLISRLSTANIPFMCCTNRTFL